MYIFSLKTHIFILEIEDVWWRCRKIILPEHSGKLLNIREHISVSRFQSVFYINLKNTFNEEIPDFFDIIYGGSDRCRL